MPVMDGLEASKEILKIDSGAKMLVLGAMGDEEFLNEAETIGVRNFIKKHFNSEQIIEAIKELACFV